MSVVKNIVKETNTEEKQEKERLKKIYGDHPSIKLVADCEHDYQKVNINDIGWSRSVEKCSKCKHEKNDWGCVTQGLCDRCNKYSCRRCNEVAHCSLCDQVFCDDCVKKRYCICKKTPYCFECLENHGGFCSQQCRREDRGFVSSEDESSHFNSESDDSSEEYESSSESN